MTTRRFGPTLGAGVVVVESESDKPITPARLGVTVMTGILEKGRTGELIFASKRKDFVRKAGGFIPASLLPDAAFDFYNFSNGNGELYLYRVTDGTERPSELTLFSRHRPNRRPVLKVTADNGGRWGGKRQFITDEFVSLTGNTLNTGKAMLKNEFKDAQLRLSAIPGKSFPVMSNDKSGVLTVPTDVDLAAEIGNSNNKDYIVELFNDGKAISVRVLDGQDDPTNEFALEVFVDGALAKRFPNLSMDPDSPHYVVSTINDDAGNFEIQVEDLNTGTISRLIRPANVYGTIKTVTSTVLTFDPFEVLTNAPGGSVAAIGPVTLGGSIKPDTLTLTVTSDSTPGSAIFSVVSANQGDLPDLTEGVEFVMNEFGLNFTLTETGTTPFANGDQVTVILKPLIPNELVGQILIPDHPNERRAKFVIESNDVDSITVATGNDLTTVASSTDEFLVSSLEDLGGGYDGIESITDADFIRCYDNSVSPIKNLFGQSKGFVKLATPGTTSVAVQKAGLAFAEANNLGYRVEVRPDIITEDAAESFVNEQIGKSDFGKVNFPSFGFVPNPEGEGLKLVSLSGSLLGREALVANQNGGYHKIAAGVDVTLPNVVKLPTSDKVLDEDFLNPQGINVIKFKNGNAIAWGARSISVDPAFRFVNQREQLSHFENIFRESFDFIIFSINNQATREQLKSSFTAFFLNEFNVTGSIVGNSFSEAVSIKIDEENNPPEQTALGNLNAEIKVRIPGTVERFVITIGQAGIFEDLTT